VTRTNTLAGVSYWKPVIYQVKPAAAGFDLPTVEFPAEAQVGGIEMGC
jgi:hypothetical protein